MDTWTQCPLNLKVCDDHELYPLVEKEARKENNKRY
jgi:hypothetical protein